MPRWWWKRNVITDVDTARHAYEQSLQERKEVIEQLKKERKIKRENHLGLLIFDALRGHR